jgi:hypothetical protein
MCGLLINLNEPPTHAKAVGRPAGLYPQSLNLPIYKAMRLDVVEAVAQNHTCGYNYKLRLEPEL